VGVSVGTAVAGKDVAVYVEGMVEVGGTAVFVTSATRVGTAALSTVELAVGVSSSTPHPISSRQNSKMQES
jgi:hypothetical protein